MIPVDVTMKASLQACRVVPPLLLPFSCSCLCVLCGSCLCACVNCYDELIYLCFFFYITSVFSCILSVVWGQMLLLHVCLCVCVCVCVGVCVCV